MKNIAVVGCTVTLSPGTGVAQITTQASLKVKADGKGVYFGPIDIAVSAYSDSTITVSGSGAGTITIQPSAQKVKVEGKREYIGNLLTILIKKADFPLCEGKIL